MPNPQGQRQPSFQQLRHLLERGSDIIPPQPSRLAVWRKIGGSETEDPSPLIRLELVQPGDFYLIGDEARGQDYEAEDFIVVSQPVNEEIPLYIWKAAAFIMIEMAQQCMISNGMLDESLHQEYWNEHNHLRDIVWDNIYGAKTTEDELTYAYALQDMWWNPQDWGRKRQDSKPKGIYGIGVIRSLSVALGSLIRSLDIFSRSGVSQLRSQLIEPVQEMAAALTVCFGFLRPNDWYDEFLSPFTQDEHGTIFNEWAFTTLEAAQEAYAWIYSIYAENWKELQRRLSYRGHSV